MPHARKSPKPGLTNRLKRGTDSKLADEKQKSLNCEIGVVSVSLGKSAVRSLKPKQHLQGLRFRGLWMGLVGSLSYRGTANTLNDLLHREDDEKLKASTLKDWVEAQGKSLTESYTKKTTNVLEKYGVDPQTGLIDPDLEIAKSMSGTHLSSTLGEEAAKKRITEYNRGKETDLKLKYSESLSQIETTSEGCCYISIDDIGVKSQKEKRDATYTKKKKFLENTVIHIQADNQQYTITAIGMKNAFTRLVAFLLENHLMEGHCLVFFSDGATIIRDYVEKYFGFRQHTIILDWLHLKKKCNEFLSMGIRGSKEERAQIKKELVSRLWTGRIEKAIKYIDSIKLGNIKSASVLANLKDYLKRKSPNVPCYAMRREFKLRISSNRVEKANDMVVATRQKHNGMSWSMAGSGALAVMTAASINGELGAWLKTGEVGFKMVG